MTHRALSSGYNLWASVLPCCPVDGRGIEPLSPRFQSPGEGPTAAQRTGGPGRLTVVGPSTPGPHSSALCEDRLHGGDLAHALEQRGDLSAAVSLARAGYPAWTICDGALVRAIDFLWRLQGEFGGEEWWDSDRAPSAKHALQLVSSARGPIVWTSTQDQGMDHLSVTHPTRAALGADRGV